MKIRSLGFIRRLFLVSLVSLLFVANDAHACQLVCQMTNTKYPGDLGGIDGPGGADAKCNAEFPGFKFARSLSVLGNLSGGNTHSVFYFGWAGTHILDITGGAMSCGSGSPLKPHTSSSNAQFGSTTRNNNSGASAPQADPASYRASCDTVLPILCCNM